MHPFGAVLVHADQQGFGVGERLVEIALGQARLTADRPHARRLVATGSEQLESGAQEAVATLGDAHLGGNSAVGATRRP